MTVGERIKYKRIEQNMSQEELAQKVGYKSRSSIQKIENARDLPLKKVALVANALNCSPSYLMGWNDDSINNIPEKIGISIHLSDKELSIVNFYRDDPSFRDMVDRMLLYSQKLHEKTDNK